MSRVLFMKKITIRKRIIMINLPALLVAFSLTLCVTYVFMQKYTNNFLRNYLELTQIEMCRGLELVLKDINLMAVDLLLTPEIYSLISHPEQDHKKTEQKIIDILKNAFNGSNIIEDIMIITGDGRAYRISDRDDLFLPEKSFLEQINVSSLSAIYGAVVKDNAGNSYILNGRRFRNFNTAEDIGYLVIYIKTDAIQQLYDKSLKNWGYSFLMTDQYIIMSHPDGKKVGSLIYENNLFRINNSYNYYTSDFDRNKVVFAISRFDDNLRKLGLNWSIVSVIPKNKITGMMVEVNRLTLMLELILIGLTLLLSMIVSSYIVKPVERLKNNILRFKGNAPKLLKNKFVKSGDEIWELEMAYDDMVIRIDDLIKKNNEEKERQRILELEALQAQINPHFLYNTLDTIAWTAKLKQGSVEKLVVALARFFRISLHNGDKLITVREEISLVKSFVTIEEERFPNKLTIQYNLEDEILEQPILKLTLQPIVENAIKHGIECKNGMGKIVVNGFKQDENIVLEVIDDGVGFDTESYNPLEQSAKKQSGGYGLKNVNQRIKLEYGEKYGIRIFSEVNKGTRVILLLKEKE